MKNRSLIGICAVAVLAGSFAITRGDNPPATAPAPVNVSGLIEQLGSDDSSARDSAQKQLVDLGPSVKPALEKAAEKTDDPEIRSRALAAIAQLNRADANASTDASLITLHRNNALLQDVLNDIGAQAHAHLSVGASAAGKHNGSVDPVNVAVDVDKKPFWEVTSDLCRQVNYCPDLGSIGQNQLRLFPIRRNWMTDSPHQIAGPFWVSVVGLYRNRTLDMMGPQQISDEVSVKIAVLPEPKLNVSLMSDFVLKDARDDAGHSLLPSREGMGSPVRFHSAQQFNYTLGARLQYPKEPGARIKLLTGDVQVVLAGEFQQYELDEVLTSPKVVSAVKGANLQFNITRKSPGFFLVEIQFHRDGLNDDQWAAITSRGCEMSLEDDKSHPLIQREIRTSAVADKDTNLIAGTYKLATEFFCGNPAHPTGIKVGEPRTFKWKIATGLKVVDVPVSFNDLPMP